MQPSLCQQAPYRRADLSRRHRPLIGGDRHDLTPTEFARRHRVLVWLLTGHIPLLGVIGVTQSIPTEHIVAELALIAVLWSAARWLPGRLARANAVAAGLLTCSAVLVHFTNGRIDSHFHFFVVLGFVALYQDWRPYAMALVFIVGHHLAMGLLLPEAVFETMGAGDNPLPTVVVHALYVVGAVVAQMLLWQVVSDAQESAEAQVRTVMTARHRDALAVVGKVGVVDDVTAEVSTLMDQALTALDAVRGAQESLVEAVAQQRQACEDISALVSHAEGLLAVPSSPETPSAPDALVGVV